MDFKKFIKELENSEQFEKQITDNINLSFDENIDNIIKEIIEHYPFYYKIHEEIFKVLLKKSDPKYILEHCKIKNSKYEMKIIYLIYKYGDKELIKNRKKELENLFIDNLLTHISKDEESVFSLKKYINGDVILNKTAIKKLISKNPFSKASREQRNYSNYFYILNEEKLKKVIEIILTSKNKSVIKILIECFYKDELKSSDKYILDQIIELNIYMEDFLKSIIKHFSYNKKLLSKFLNYLENNEVNCLKLGLKFSNRMKKIILENLYGEKKVKREASLLIDYLGEEKSITQSALINLKNLDKSVISEVENKIYSQIKDYTGEKEIASVEILCYYATDKKKLRNIYEILVEPKSRDNVAKTIGLELKNLYKNSDGEFDLEIYLDAVYKEEKNLPIKINELTLPIRKDGKDATRAVEQLIISYKNSSKLSINKEALLIANCFTNESMINFAKSVLKYWLKIPKYTVEEWPLLIPIIHGDSQLLNEISNLIQSLAKNLIYTSFYLIKAFELNKTKEANEIIKRTRIKLLSEIDESHFKSFAKQLGVTKRELSDRLITDIGFTDEFIPLNYGNQVIKLFIGSDFKFEIETQNGKRIKSLPKGTKDDNKNLIADAKEKFKLLKKQLRSIVKVQTNAMEDALITHSLWSAKKWKNLFLNNPIMNSVGKRLLWGIYEDNKLIKSFSFDSEIFDMNYENISLDNNQMIGIVHPLELSENHIKVWKEIFKDNENEILFNQLDREILKIENENLLEFRPKNYPRKSPNTLVNRLTKKGWNIGSIRSRGGFEELYKEIKELNLGVELTVNGNPGRGPYGYEAYGSEDNCIGVEKIEFYKLGTIKRGNYDYDELEEYKGLRYLPKELPKRIVSELLLEIKKGLS